MRAEESQYVTTKAGGFMMASPDRIRRTKDIVVADPSRRFIVVSAPDAHGNHPRVTPMLRKPFDRDSLMSVQESFDKLRFRMEGIGNELHVYSVHDYFSKVEEYLKTGQKVDPNWFISRGEYTMAMVFAEFMEGAFIDAHNLIHEREKKRHGQVVYDVYSQFFDEGSYYQVVPGFYYAGPRGEIRLFPPNGSDLTGAIIAFATRSKRYDNIKNTEVRTADPHIVPNAGVIHEMTYDEMRNTARHGSEVLQPETTVRVHENGIPIQVIDGTNEASTIPDYRGTLITRERISPPGEGVIGIAAKADNISLTVIKVGLDNMEGVGGKLFGILAGYGVSYERNLDTVDTIEVIFPKVDHATLNSIISSMRGAFGDIRTRVDQIAIVSMVGQNLAEDDQNKALARSLAALTNSGVGYEFVSYPKERTSYTIGVRNDKVKEAVQVLHKALIEAPETVAVGESEGLV